MKQCSKCKEWKDESKFSKSRSHGESVLHYYCKQCVSEYDKQRLRTEEGKEYQRAKMRKFYKTQTGKEARKRSGEKHFLKEENRLKQIARRRLNTHIKLKKFPHISTQKCSECRKQAQHYHHHNGYDEAHYLDVIPLCAICHSQIG